MQFGPTMLVAATEGALAPARLLRHYLRHRAAKAVAPDSGAANEAAAGGVPDVPILTPKLELYDEDANPYLAHIKGTSAWGARRCGHAQQLVRGH